MQINHLTLKNFRNHKHFKLSFEPGITLIVGPNGIGKTNILEAIYVLATAKSQRAQYDRDLISYEQEFCSIHGKTAAQQDEFDLELQIIKQGDNTHIASKKAKVNKVAKSISGFTGIFNAVMFSPEDISIITGSPSERRRFLDLILSQTDKHYRRQLNSYIKAVRQRNKVLELIHIEGRGANQMDFWNEQITTLGNLINEKRAEFVDFVNLNLPGLMIELDKTKTVCQLEYKESKITDTKLGEYFNREVAAKSTLIGPHREDFKLFRGGHDIAEFGSRGQQRAMLLALKLLEINYIEKIKGERPVLLLDDVFSELDDLHRHTILQVIDSQQTIITTAESESALNIGSKNITTITL